jgi:hypothetical protein
MSEVSSNKFPKKNWSLGVNLGKTWTLHVANIGGNISHIMK